MTNVGSWDKKYFGLALHVRGWVKGPDLGVGAVVVSPDKSQLSVGYSGLPRGIADTKERLIDGSKNIYGMHAELNAILNARCCVAGWALYSTRTPCAHCAAAAIQAGIARVVTARPTVSRWQQSQEIGLAILKEAGVEIIFTNS